MHKMVPVLVLAALLGGVPGVFAQDALEWKTSIVRMAFPYGKAEGHELIFLVRKSGTASVCVRVDDAVERLETAAAYDLLKKEVRYRFATMRAQQDIGTSGRVFTYGGGYPLWFPFLAQQNSRAGMYQCLQFAEGVKIDGLRIYAEGQSAKPEGEYPSDYGR